MSKTIGQFDYTLRKMREADDLPVDPIVVLTLKRWGTDDGAPAISAHLMSDREIDEHVANLKQDLDRVGSLAKRALQDARRETLAKVQTRIADRGTTPAD